MSHLKSHLCALHTASMSQRRQAANESINISPAGKLQQKTAEKNVILAPTVRTHHVMSVDNESYSCNAPHVWMGSCTVADMLLKAGLCWPWGLLLVLLTSLNSSHTRVISSVFSQTEVQQGKKRLVHSQKPAFHRAMNFSSAVRGERRKRGKEEGEGG